MKVTYNSRGRMGSQSKTIYVYSNDPDRKTARLIIKGKVIMLLRASPRSVNFGELPKGKSKTMTVRLIPAPGAKFEIEKIDPPTADYEVRIVRTFGIIPLWNAILKSSRDGLVRKFGSRTESPVTQKHLKAKPEELGADIKETKTVSVTLLPTAGTGRHSGSMRIHTNLEEKPLLQVSVVAVVVGHIKVEPPAHNFGTTQRGQTKSITFTVSSMTGKRFEINRVEDRSEHVSVELVQVQPGTVYELKAEILPDAPAGKIHGAAILHTNDTDQPKLAVRFHGRIKD